MKKILLALLMICLLLLAACGAGQPEPEAAMVDESLSQPAEEEEQADLPVGPVITETAETTTKSSFPALPEFNTTDIYGNSLDNSIFADFELTMLNIWATYCGPCIMEMPYLGEMSAEMPSGTQLVGLAADALNQQSLELAQELAEDTGANFTHIVPDQALIDYLRPYLLAVPTTLFIDSAGQVVGQELLGAQPRLVYEAELEQRLQQLQQGQN